MIDHPNPMEFHNITGEMKIKFPAALRISHVGLLQRDGGDRASHFFNPLFHKLCVYVSIQHIYVRI